MILPQPTAQSPLPSYFTCTLGEAQLFNRNLDTEAPYATVNAFVDYLADTRGDAVAVSSAGPPRPSRRGGEQGKGEEGKGGGEWVVDALSM